MKLVVLFAGIALAVSACSGSNNSPTAPTVSAPYSTVDVRVGTGTEATIGRTASVNYALYHYSATAADNKGGQIEAGPYTFVVGGGGVIQGFSMATNNMRVGGLRRAVIPPSLAYGANPPSNKIGVNETLVFEIELLAVQ